MGTNTLFKDIRKALATLTALLSLCAAAVDALAQASAPTTVVYNTVVQNGGYICGKDVGTPIINQFIGNVDPMVKGESVFPSLQRAIRPQSIVLYRVGKDGVETVIDSISSSYVGSGGVSIGGKIGLSTASDVFVGYKFLSPLQFYGGSGNLAVGNISQLQFLYIYPNRLQDAELGFTYKLRLNMSKVMTGDPTEVINIYFDAIGVNNNVTYVDPDPSAYHGVDDSYFVSPCPGSGDVTLKLVNDVHPYREDDDSQRVSYLGNRYSAVYTWRRSYDSWGRELKAVQEDATIYTDTEITSHTTSGRTQLQPEMTFLVNGEPVVDNDKCLVNFVNSYYLYFFTPLELTHAFKNLTSSAQKSDADVFTACYGDDVRYTPTFEQDFGDGGGMRVCTTGEVRWTLERLNDDESVAETLVDESIYYDGEYYDFENLTETAKYRVTCEFIDPDGHSRAAVDINGDVDGNGIGSGDACPTVKTFTINVRQVSAKSEILLPAEACEEDDVEVAAVVSALPAGDKAADYAYRWFWSDDQISYSDLNTTDYLRSGNAQWSDPTDTVKTVYKSITYRFGDDLGPQDKFIKFQLANTYEIDGQVFYCPIPNEGSLVVHKLPILDPIDEVYVCKGQKASFRAFLYDRSIMPEYTTGLGMTYEVFTDAACTQKATEVINLVGEKDRPVAEGDDNTNYNRLDINGHEGAYAWFGLKKVEKDSYTFYVRVKNEQTGCYSHPQEVKIVALPQPQVASVVPNPDAYCLNADASKLEVTAKVVDEHGGFYTALSRPVPKVTYHWSVFKVDGGSLLTQDVYDDAVLKGLFADNRVTAYVGDVLFRVYATDDSSCGYVLDYDGSVLTPSQFSTSAEEAVVTINPLPDFTIQDGVKACSDQGRVTVELKSNDSRELAFRFEPVGSAPAPEVSTVKVAGLSSNLFATNVAVSDVKDVTTYEYNVKVTDDTSLACDTDAVLRFTAYPVPALTMLPAAAGRHLCQGDDIVLGVDASLTEGGKAAAAADFSYSWTIDGAPVTAAESYTWTTDYSTAVGQHMVVVTVSYTFADGHVCSTTQSMEIFVDAVPTFDFEKDETICEGGSVTLRGSVTNASVANHLGIANVFDHEFVNAADNSSAKGKDTGSGYSWTYTVSPERTTTYRFRPTNATTGCVTQDYAEVTITVDRKARVNFVTLSENEVCEGRVNVEIDYEVTNPDEFGSIDWSTLTVDGFTVSSFDDATIVLEGDVKAGSVVFGSASMSATTDKGCDVVFLNSLTLKVNPIPAAPVVQTPADNEVCYHQKENFVFRVQSRQRGYTYEYFFSDAQPAVDAAPTGTFSWNPGTFTIDGSLLETTTNIWVRAVDSNNPTACKSAFAGPFTIVVNKTEAPSLAPIAEVCQGDKATLTVVAPLAEAGKTYTYRFYGNSDVEQNSASVSYTTKTLDQSAVYYVTATQVETNCTSEVATVNVAVHVKPVGSASVAYQGEDGSYEVTMPVFGTVTRSAFCEGEGGTATVTLTAPTLHNQANPWTSELVSVSYGSVADWTKVDEAHYTCGKPVWDQPVTLSFKIGDGVCVSASFEATVAVEPTLVAPQIACDIAEFCRDDDKPFTFSVTNPSADSDVKYVFYARKQGEAVPFLTEGSADGRFSSSTAVAKIDASSEFYAYAFNTKTGCVSPVSNTVTITVNELPVPTVSATPNVVCPGEDVELKVNETFVAYEWLDYGVKGQTTQTVKVVPTETENVFNVKVTDGKGCVSKPVPVTVTVFPKPQFTLSVAPDVVCQGSDDKVIFALTPLNDLASDASSKVEFASEYAFTSSSADKVVQHVGAEYFVDGKTWTEASVTFSATIMSTSAYNSCLSEEVSTTVTVIPSLAKPLTDKDDVHVCTGSDEEVTISVANVAAYPTTGGVSYSYHWYTDAAGTNEVVDGAGYAVSGSSISFVPKATTTLYVKVVRETYPKCESELSSAATVTIEPLPDAPVAVDPLYFVCQPEESGNMLNLNVSSPASDYVYHWYVQSDGEVDADMADDAEVAVATGSATAKIPTPTETIFLYVRAESKYGCFSADKSNVVKVRKGDNPEVVTLSAPKADVCSGDEVSFAVGVAGDNAEVTYLYNRTSSDPMESPVTGAVIDASGLFAETLTVSETVTYSYEVWARYADHCLSLNSVKFDVTVHGKPTGASQIASSLCENDEFVLTVKNVKSHDLVSHSNPADAKLRVVLFASDGTELAQSQVAHGMHANLTYNGGLMRSMLPLYYEIQDLVDVVSISCPMRKDLSFALVDVPRFTLANKDGKVETVAADGAIEVDYCEGEDMNLAMVGELPTVDAEGHPIQYTYQWRYEGANIVGQISTSFSKSGLGVGDSGAYELVAKTDNDAACEFSRVVRLTVHALPAPKIEPGNALDIYCTDGDLVLKTADDYASYRWVIKGKTDIVVSKLSPDVELRYPIADIAIPDGQDYVDVELYATDIYGCESVLPDLHSAIVSTPPVITEVLGTEVCGQVGPFRLGVVTDKANYTLRLFNADNVELPLTEQASGSGLVFVTPDTLSEGDYTVRVVDKDSNCFSEQVVRLVRYDVSVAYTPVPNRFFCENGVVEIELEVFDANGHADFFSRLQDVSFAGVVTNYGYSYNLPAIDISSGKAVVRFEPQQVSPVMAASDVAYTLEGTFSYKLASRADDALVCVASPAQNFYVMPEPVLVSNPVMPLCLDAEVEFEVKTDNINPAWEKHFQFYVNGVAVENAGGDYSSNVFRLADHPEISLKDGDKVTAEVVMNERGNMCVTDPITVLFNGAFKPVLGNAEPDRSFCKGSDISFSVESVMPDGVEPSFKLSKIKSYELFLVGDEGDQKLKEYDAVDALTHIGSFSYSGSERVIRLYAVVTDENDCVVRTSEVEFKIDQWEIVDVVVSDGVKEYSTTDLCADVDYTYDVKLSVGEGVDTEAQMWEYTLTIGGTEWSDPADRTFAQVTKSHPKTDGQVELVVDVYNPVTGCKTSLGGVYPSFTKLFSYHDKPQPGEKLKDNFLPVSDDVADTAKFEVCYEDDFGFDVTGDVVTVVYDGVRVATYRKGLLEATFSDILATDRINVSYVAGEAGRPGTTVLIFNIDPSADFHKLSFAVSDDACEVASDDWMFRKFEKVYATAVNGANVDVLDPATGIATVCEDDSLVVTPYTSEPNYVKGYNFFLDGVLVSADDFSATSFTFPMSAKGDYELLAVPDFGRNGCHLSVTVKVLEAPKPSVSLSGENGAVAPDASGVLFWQYSICEEESDTLTLAGAENFALVAVERDGVDVTADFAERAFAGLSATVPLSLNYVAGGPNADFSTYTFTVSFAVGSCEEVGRVVVNVYNKPEAEFINGTPAPLVIAGSQVPVDVTPGYADYKFFINGALVQEGATNTLDGSLNVVSEGTTFVKVVVYNDFGCSIVLERRVEVLDGIAAKNIVASSDFYCSDDEGVKISVVDPQVGVTYVVDGRADLAPVLAEEGKEVAWSPVRLADPMNLNPEEFTVKAYYEALAGQLFPMANTVVVEEVKSPAPASADDVRAIDCALVQSSAFTWTVHNTSLSDSYWLQMEDGTVLGPGVDGNGGDLVMPVYDMVVATYGAVPNGVINVVARSKRLNGDWVCDKLLAGRLTVDLPTTTAFEVRINPGNGNVCADNSTALDIFLSGSDFSSEFDHVYILMRDGVEVDRKVSDAQRGEIHFVDSEPLVAGAYVYSVVCEFSGCRQPMANTVTKTVFDRPLAFKLHAVNDGYYCYDDPNAATIVLDGQQEGYKYELKKKGAASAAVQTVIGDASGAQILFNGVSKGEYYVEVSIPQVEGSACSTVIDDGVVVTEVAEPADITPSIAKSGWGGSELTICVGESYEVRISGADFDWLHMIVNRSYALYDENGTLISDQMVNVDEQNGTLAFPGMTATASGTFKYTIVATGSVDILSTGGSVDCQKVFEDALTLTVKERPHSGETLTVDYSPVPENPCYGADIIVNNPNLDAEAKVSYSLYLVDDKGAYVPVVGATIRPYDGDDARFTNIKDKDARYVVLADNGSCQDVVGEVSISQDKFAKVQVLDFDGYVCLGDPGVPAYMKDSEADVLYELYFISPALYASLEEAGNLSADYLAENVPGVKLAEALATYDHERLVFAGLNYGDGSEATEVVNRDGYYYAVATKNSAPNPCPVASPIVNFQTLDLPKSFTLEESTIYCDPVGNANVYIEQAEYDPNATISYRLYSEDKEGNLTFYDEVSSSPASAGNRLYFAKPVVEGAYVAVAVKEYGAEFGNHICTSRMRGRIELSYAPALDALVFAQDVDLTLCDGEDATYTLDNVALSEALANVQATLPAVKGLYVFLTPVDSPVEGASTKSIFFDGSNEVTFTGIPEGQNVVRVSYEDYACLVDLGSIFVNRYDKIPTGLRATACGTEYSLSSAYTVEGVTYELADFEGTVVQTVTCDAIFSPVVKFGAIAPGDYTIYGSFQNGTLCKVEVGKLSVRGVVPSAVRHEVVFCAGEPVVYEIPQELLFNNAYYYVTDELTRPDEYAEELYHYAGATGSGSLKLTNLVDGQNVIWVAFDGYSCLTAVDTVVVTRYPDLPSNVLRESVCGLEFNLDPAYLVENATYHFSERGGVNVADVTYNAGSDVTFVAPAVGEYVVSMTTAEGKCSSSLGTVAFRGGIDASSPIVASVVACGESSVTFDLASDAYRPKLVEGLTYYVVKTDSDPMSEAAFGRKYVAGQKTLFSVAAPGDYKIWASFDNYSCQTEVGSLAVTEVGMEDVELSAVWSCDNVLTFSISPSAIGANYELYAVARDKSEALVGVALAGTGDKLSWPAVDYDASAYRYEVRASAGDCPPLTVAVLYGVSIRQDFDIVAANFYSVGGACSSEPVQLVLDESVVGISYYLTLDGEDSRVPLAGTEKEGDGSRLVWTSAELPVQTGVVTYRLYAYKGDLSTTGCFSGDLWRSVTINFEATTFPVGHLVTKDDILDYCEGEVGVRIGYVDTPRKGEVYRLYRKVDDSENLFGAELMDIQEIPSYATEVPDTLFFDGWGYNESIREYATAGVYFVEVESAQGCDPVATDSITVVEHKLPGASEDSVYFAIKTKGEVDTTSVSFEYGVINGYIFYQTARPGYTYELVKDDTVTVVSKVVDKVGLLEFGPILETILDSVEVDGEYKPFERIEVVGDSIFSGEGIYSVRITDNVTSCENTIGGITIVAEGLVAYNVQIYLNKNENARTVDLVPLYDYDTDLAHKGNHLYIDWSSKIDRIYRPYVSISQDGYPYNEESVSTGITRADHPNFFRYGYANVAGDYKDHTYIGKSGESNVWFNIVDDPETKVSGTYGFIDVDYQLGIDESIISKSTPAGYFFYMKQPSFYGQEQVQYYIENRQMPGRRSNIATITILCGNEDVGDDEDAVFLVPNAFSPNGDGLNDYFKILIPEKYQDNSESKLEVFNRWGTLVYRSSGLQYGSDGVWWDGTSTTSNMVTLGSELPSGTYYYVFTITFINKADTQKYERKMHGYVELRR